MQGSHRLKYSFIHPFFPFLYGFIFYICILKMFIFILLFFMLQKGHHAICKLWGLTFYT